MFQLSTISFVLLQFLYHDTHSDEVSVSEFAVESLHFTSTSQISAVFFQEDCNFMRLHISRSWNSRIRYVRKYIAQFIFGMKQSQSASNTRWDRGGRASHEFHHENRSSCRNKEETKIPSKRNPKILYCFLIRMSSTSKNPQHFSKFWNWKHKEHKSNNYSRVESERFLMFS